MGAATSGFAAEIYMEHLESSAMATFAHPPSIWRRYVDDTFVKLRKECVESFLIHLNSLHPRIVFTTESMIEGKIAFLDTLVTVQEDGRLKIGIYRKATHTDQYLDFTSNHHISQKLGIVSTFRHRIDSIITTEDDRKEEESRMMKKMRICGYPEWTLKRRNRRKKNDDEQRAVISIP